MWERNKRENERNKENVLELRNWKNLGRRMRDWVGHPEKPNHNKPLIVHEASEENWFVGLHIFIQRKSF